MSVLAHRIAMDTTDTTGATRLGIGLLATVGLFTPMFPTLAREWSEFPSLSHGFAIPIIAAYMVWLRRSSIAALPHRPSWRWLPVFTGAVVVYVVGTLGGETFIARAAFPVALLGIALFLSGLSVARQLAPGIGFLLFMIPPPYIAQKALTDHARLFDAAVTGAVLPWLGVPVLREGYLLHLPNMTLEVADVCSSIPAIVSLLALGTLYGMITRRPPVARVLLVLLAVPIGIGSNIMRITLTAVGAYVLGPIALQNFVHEFSGTVVFLMTFVGLMVLDFGIARARSLR